MTQEKEHEDRTTQENQRANSDPSEGLDGAGLDPHIQEELGRVFRSFCNTLIEQPIPDKFVVLLAKLEAKQREKK